MSFDLFGDRSRILTEIFCNVLEGNSLVKGIFNESTIPYEEVNINCAEVNATGFQDGGIYKFISGQLSGEYKELKFGS